jgi:uncharacterized protein
MAKFQWWLAQDRNYYWHLKANNGEIVAQGEGYTSKEACLKGITFVKANAAAAKVEELRG